MSGPHDDHGRGDENGPDHPDCPCRATPRETECAQAGCGFCRSSHDNRVVVEQAEELDALDWCKEKLASIHFEPGHGDELHDVIVEVGGRTYAASTLAAAVALATAA